MSKQSQEQQDAAYFAAVWLGGPCAIDHHPVLSPPEPNWAHQGQDYWPGREAAMDALIDFLMERLVGMGL